MVNTVGEQSTVGLQSMQCVSELAVVARLPMRLKRIGAYHQVTTEYQCMLDRLLFAITQQLGNLLSFDHVKTIFGSYSKSQLYSAKLLAKATK